MSRIAKILLAGACSLAFTGATQAASVDGAWVTNPSACNQVFVKKGGKINFTRAADMYGSGFIVEGDKLRGKIATCKVKARKEDGDTVNILATCATDIMFSDNQFSLKIVDQNKITRIFPGLPELKTDYFRCPM